MVSCSNRTGSESKKNRKRKQSVYLVEAAPPSDSELVRLQGHDQCVQ